MIWSKQFFYYDVPQWLKGDPGQPPPPAGTRTRPQPRVEAPEQRRHHLDAGQVGVPVVRRLGSGVPHAFRWRWSIRSLPSSSCVLLTREWYMHPNGQLPAYEWAFGDVNPPVHALGDLARLPDGSQTRR